MPRICGLERDRNRRCQEYDVEDVRKRHVAMVRTFIVAPAQVHSELFRGNIHDRMIEGLDVKLRAFAEVCEIQIGILDVASHAEVGTVDLKYETGAGDRFILAPRISANTSMITVVATLISISKR